MAAFVRHRSDDTAAPVASARAGPPWIGGPWGNAFGVPDLLDRRVDRLLDPAVWSAAAGLFRHDGRHATPIAAREEARA